MLTPLGIDAATFRFVAQWLTHCATATTDMELFFFWLVQV
jgi:hypothetical protein